MTLLGVLITLSIVVALFFVSEERLLPVKERTSQQVENFQQRSRGAGSTFARKQAAGIWEAKKAEVAERAQRAGLTETETTQLLSNIEKKIFSDMVISSDAIDVIIDSEIQAILSARRENKK